MTARTRELTPAQHAHIRLQLVLIPAYLYLIYGYINLYTLVPRMEPVHDFAHFYVQGAIARAHDARALYDVDAMADVLARVVPATHRAPFPPAYGPQVAMLFAPLAALPYTAAMWTWLAISVAVYAACCHAIWTTTPRLHGRPGTVALLLAAAPGFHFLLGFVQASAIGLACATALYLALRAARPFLAGLAIGALAYKPPLGLAAAFVLVLAGEWPIVLGALTAIAIQGLAALWYWGPSVFAPYVAALVRLPKAAEVMESYKYQMHSWRSFFDLAGLPGGWSLAAYAVASLVTTCIALLAWRRRGPLVLRYSALMAATVLVDPHMYSYDFVLLTPALLLLWDWALAQPERSMGDVLHWWPRPLRGSSFRGQFQWLLYVCYLSPLFGIVAEQLHLQASVPALFVLLLVVAAGIR